MGILDKIYLMLSSQIIRSDVTLPVIDKKSPKIQDNNQSISIGVINEKSNFDVRSSSSTGAKRRRSTKS